MFLLSENLWFSVDGHSFLEDRASALPAVPSPSEEVSALALISSHRPAKPLLLTHSAPLGAQGSRGLICHCLQSSRPSSDFPVTSLQTLPTSVTTQILWPFTTSTLTYIFLSQVDCELLDRGK